MEFKFSHDSHAVRRASESSTSRGAGPESAHSSASNFSMLLERVAREHALELERAVATIRAENAALVSEIKSLRRLARQSWEHDEPTRDTNELSYDVKDFEPFRAGSEDAVQIVRNNFPTSSVAPVRAYTGTRSQLPPTLASANEAEKLKRDDSFQMPGEVQAVFHSGLLRRDSMGSCHPSSINDDEDEDDIQLVSIWRSGRGKGRGSVLKSTSFLTTHGTCASFKRSSSLASIEYNPPREYASFVVRLIARLVQNPSSKNRLAWDVVGALFVVFDTIVVPMQMFDVQRVSTFPLNSWLSAVFWTVDIPCSFLVGYHSEGSIEMDPSKISRHYTLTWLPFDLFLVSIDWLLYFPSGKASEGIKFLDFVRLLRLLKLLVAQNGVHEVIDRIQSESCIIVFGIVKLLAFIMMINHFNACMWYGIGVWDREREDTWVRAHDLVGKDMSYKYATALHWSLTQFTPASSEVFPQNSHERGFTVLVILFAMVTFSSFVSAITNAMTQLRNLNSERNEQASILRRYLGENRVSTYVKGHIWGCLQQAGNRSKRRVHEADVAILHLLPTKLKTQLQHEVYAPVLCAHPFFKEYGSLYRLGMSKIYQNGLEEISLGNEKELFSSGEACDRMFFVVCGELSYSRVPSEPSIPVVSEQWMCEAVLWIIWKHAGQMTGTMPCDIIALRAAKVQELLINYAYEEIHVKRYARIFVRFMKRNPTLLTDIWADIEVLREMARQAFSDAPDEDDPRCPGSPLGVLPEEPAFRGSVSHSGSNDGRRRSVSLYVSNALATALRGGGRRPSLGPVLLSQRLQKPQPMAAKDMGVDCGSSVGTSSTSSSGSENKSEG